MSYIVRAVDGSILSWTAGFELMMLRLWMSLLSWYW